MNSKINTQNTVSSTGCESTHTIKTLLRIAGKSLAVAILAISIPASVPSKADRNFFIRADFIKAPLPPTINYVTEIPIDLYYDQKKGWDVESLKAAQDRYINFLRAYPEDMITDGIPNNLWAMMPMIKSIAASKGIDPYILAAFSFSESFYYKYSIGTKGEIGLMQIYPKANKRLLEGIPPQRLFDPEINIAIGADIFKYDLEAYKNNLPKAIAAYNAGQERVSQNMIPDQTKNYVARILENAVKIRKLDSTMSHNAI